MATASSRLPSSTCRSTAGGDRCWSAEALALRDHPRPAPVRGRDAGGRSPPPRRRRAAAASAASSENRTVGPSAACSPDAAQWLASSAATVASSWRCRSSNSTATSRWNRARRVLDSSPSRTSRTIAWSKANHPGVDLPQEPGGDGGLGCGLGCPVVETGDGGHDRQLEGDPGYRRGSEQRSHVIAQPAHTAADDLLDALGERPASPARLGEMPGDLHHEERVATRGVVHAPRRRGAITGGDARHDLGHLGLGEATQVDPFDRRVREVGQHPGQGPVPPQLGGAVGADDEHGPVGRGPHDVAEEGERRLVGPVEVIDDEEHRRHRRQPPYRAGHRLEQRPAIAPAAVNLPEAVGEARQQGCEDLRGRDPRRGAASASAAGSPRGPAPRRRAGRA